MDKGIKREIVKLDYVKPGQIVLERSLRYDNTYEYRRVTVVETISRIGRVVVAYGEIYSRSEKEILSEGFNDEYKTIPMDNLYTVKETNRSDKLDLVNTEEDDV